MDVRSSINPQTLYPNWQEIGGLPPGQLPTSLHITDNTQRNLTIAHLMRTAANLQLMTKKEAHANAIAVLNVLQPIALPDSLIHRLCNALVDARIISSEERKATLKAQKTESITFFQAVECGFEKKAVEIYMRGNEAKKRNYQAMLSRNKFFSLCCRTICEFDTDRKRAIYQFISQCIEADYEVVRVSDQTKRSPLEDLIDSGGDISYVMSRVSLDVREELTLDYRNAYDPEIYEHLDRGDFIYMLSVPSFWENVIDCCLTRTLSTSSPSENAIAFPFLNNATMIAFSYYINDWVRKYMNDPEDEGETNIFQKLLNAIDTFTANQQEDFFRELEDTVSNFIKEAYKNKHGAEMQRRLAPLLNECGRIFNRSNTSPSSSEIHSFTADKLECAAINKELAPEQRLTALCLFTETAKFKQLPSGDRIAFFTHICNAATDQIGTIRRLVQDLKREAVWHGESMRQTAISLTTVQKNLFDLIQKTQNEAARQQPDAYSSPAVIFEAFKTASAMKPKWEALREALSAYCDEEGLDLQKLDIDYDDLFSYIYTDRKCEPDVQAVLEILKKLDIDKLSEELANRSSK